jgi:hypothetical protein
MKSLLGTKSPAMTSSSVRLVECVRELAAAGAVIDERADALVLRGQLPSAQSQSWWIECAANAPPPIPSVQVYDLGIGGDLGPDDVFSVDRKVVITIQKPAIPGVVVFIFQASLARYLAERCLSSRIAVVDLAPTQSFIARGLEVVHWELPAAPVPSEAAPIAIDPTPYVRDFVPDREIVSDLSPWMLHTAPATMSVAFAAWEAMAARRLLAGLVSSASLTDGRVWLQCAGPPIYRIRADEVVGTSRARLTEAAAWVFLSGTDVEVRHLLFATELARAQRDGEDFIAILKRALEAAKAAYEAHVQSASRETLKALADLRKSVVEETQKVVQRAQDLTGNLWRDLAVSAAPFVMKIFTDAGKAPAPVISAIFYFVAAAFVALSFILQWRINSRFFASQSKARKRWMQTLYSYISEREREEIAEAPINDAVRGYWETWLALLVVYVCLVSFLIFAGARTLHTNWIDSLATQPAPATDE